MAKERFSRTAFRDATDTFTTKGKASTYRGEEQVRITGKLDPLVDPAEYGIIRESRMRFEERPDGLFIVANGTPIPEEYRLDTTGSMGDNVDRALAALPKLCGLVDQALPGRDPFYCASIFGDLMDRDGEGFPLCRGQFEAEATKMVNQLTLMHPERDGRGNGGEDPHYGLFAAAYLTKTYLSRIGLRGYDFIITDEPMHDRLSPNQLQRIFGSEVFDKARENGFPISPGELPSNEQVVKDLFHLSHAFALLVTRGRDGQSLIKHWQSYYGRDRVIVMPDIEYLPHVMATIIGLTEGTFDLQSAADFLAANEVTKREAKAVVDAVAHIPLGAQQVLPNFGKMPKVGDVFRSKTELWPIDPDEVPVVAQSTPASEAGKKPGGWL